MVQTKRSKTPSPPPSISYPAFQPGKPGDWQCLTPSCRNHQTPGCFASAAACKQCGAPKPGAFALLDSSATNIPGDSVPAGATVLYRKTARSRGLPFDIHASSGAMRHDTSGGVMCASFAANDSLDKGSISLVKGSLRQAIEAATATGALVWKISSGLRGFVRRPRLKMHSSSLFSIGLVVLSTPSLWCSCHPPTLSTPSLYSTVLSARISSRPAHARASTATSCSRCLEHTQANPMTCVRQMSSRSSCHSFNGQARPRS